MDLLVLGGIKFAGRTVVDAGLGGVFNVTGEPMAFGHLLARCIAVTNSDADLA